MARPALTGYHRPLYQVGFAFLCIGVMNFDYYMGFCAFAG